MKIKDALDEHGRKYALALTAIRFFAVVVLCAIAKASVPGLDDLDLPIVAGAAGGVGALVAVYSGSNAWKAQADAKIAEATGESPYVDEDLETAD